MAAPSIARLAQLPLLKLDPADPALLEELLEVVARVASTGAFTMGAELEAFEAEFAAYCETDHAIGVSSGTEAIVLALRALRIGPGDEVIVPANSFIATAEAVSLAGATPRLVDVDPETHLITRRGRRGGDRAAHPLRDPGPPDGLDGRHDAAARASRGPPAWP